MKILLTAFSVLYFSSFASAGTLSPFYTCTNEQGDVLTVDTEQTATLVLNSIKDMPLKAVLQLKPPKYFHGPHGSILTHTILEGETSTIAVKLKTRGISGGIEATIVALGDTTITLNCKIDPIQNE